MDNLFKPLSMSYRPPPTSPEFQCYGFVAPFLLWGFDFVHSKEWTKQENNIDIWGEGGCSMYKGLNNSSIYGIVQFLEDGTGIARVKLSMPRKAQNVY